MSVLHSFLRRLHAPARISVEQAVELMREDPAHTALLFDIDGTLIEVRSPGGPTPQLSEPLRDQLRRLSTGYAMVGIVTGRRAAEARAIAGIDSLRYVGNHGGEWLESDGSTAVVPDLAAWEPRVQSFARTLDTAALLHVGIRIENKGTILVLHWRDAADPAAAEAAARAIATRAAAAGMRLTEARKALELVPPVHVDKGLGIRRLLAGHPEIRRVLYVGDDVTDIDGFRALRSLRRHLRLRCAVAVAVRSPEQPAGLERDATTTVDGVAGVHRLIAELAGP